MAFKGKLVAAGLSALASIVVGLAAAPQASATPILVDHGSYTTDTATNLEWLDLSATYGLSYNQVMSNSGVNYIGQGWRYATSAELAALFTDAGGGGHYPVTTTSSTVAGNPTLTAVAALSTLLGSGFDPVYTSYVGFLADPVPDGATTDRMLAYITGYQYLTNFYGSLIVNGGGASPDQTTYYSSFLVRSDVATTPLPASLVLFLTALGALGFTMRKRDGRIAGTVVA